MNKPHKPAHRPATKPKVFKVIIRDYSKCYHCGSPMVEDQQACGKCGFPQRGTQQQQQRFVFRYKDQQNKIADAEANIKWGRVILFIVAGINLFFAILSIAGYYGSIIDTVYSGGLTILFLILGFISLRFPFAATLSGFILYASLILFWLVMNYRYAIQGGIFKAIIIGGLVYAFISAYKLQRMKARLIKRHQYARSEEDYLGDFAAEHEHNT